MAEDGTHVPLETFAKDSEIYNYFKVADYYTHKEIRRLDILHSDVRHDRLKGQCHGDFPRDSSKLR